MIFENITSTAFLSLKNKLILNSVVIVLIKLIGCLTGLESWKSRWGLTAKNVMLNKVHKQHVDKTSKDTGLSPNVLMSKYALILSANVWLESKLLESKTLLVSKWSAPLQSIFSVSCTGENESTEVRNTSGVRGILFQASLQNILSFLHVLIFVHVFQWFSVWSAEYWSLIFFKLFYVDLESSSSCWRCLKIYLWPSLNLLAKGTRSWADTDALHDQNIVDTNMCLLNIPVHS